MKKIKNIVILNLALVSACAFTSCSDQFLEEKTNYGQVGADVYNDFNGALARVDDIYAWCLPDATANPSWKFNSTGLADDQSKSTEEYSGFGAFVNPDAPLTNQSGNNPIPDFFHGGNNNIQAMVWGRIRNCNDAISGIEGSTLTESEKNQLLGQLYFLRAWCYYNIVKWYGGVPIITKVQDPIATESLAVPRSSAKACINFICNDLYTSARLLAPFTMKGGWAATDFGRVTSGTALALLGRVRLLYASPLFNRKNDVNRWTQAYNDIKNSIDTLAACGYGLANEATPGVNGSGWASIFSQVDGNKEAVFVTLYNNGSTGAATDRNNTWEQGIRPSNTLGGGGKTPSAMLVDLFPMADGKRPSTSATYTTLEASEDFAYDAQYPFMNRDPRFYRTFAFPGVRWAFNGDPTSADNNNPYSGSNYALWNYVWYSSEDDRDNVESGNTYGPDNLLSNVKGFYIRKRSDDIDVNSNARYDYKNATAGGAGFKYSAAPYMEIRYAEVLLNYAEAACGAGHLDEAVAQLRRIRARAGYSSTNDYGLQANLSTNAQACLAAILYERQIELAYEGKRFDDLRRWMLFDGGTEKADGAPETWKLTGWGGNTCTYLGFVKLNGQRRDNLEFRVKNDYNDGLGGTSWAIGGNNPDPLKDETRPAPLDLRKDISSQQETLKTFYETYLERKKKKGDAYTSDKGEKYMMFYPRYYFLGLYQAAQTANPTLEQTIGWGDYNNGGANGTFDPLAE